MDREKENALRMLDGCICRLSVTDEKEEAYRMYYFMTVWATQILQHTLHRIEEQDRQKEADVPHVRRTKRKRQGVRHAEGLDGQST